MTDGEEIIKQISFDFNQNHKTPIVFSIYKTILDQKGGLLVFESISL